MCSLPTVEMKYSASRDAVCLPAEILEIVFANLPIYDILRSVSLVCKTWKDITHRELYLTHKKTYHKFKCMECPDVTAEVTKTANQHGMDSLGTCLEGLIRYMDNWGENTFAGGDPVKKHPKYTMGLTLLKEKFPSLVLNSTGTTRNPWSLVAGIIILAEDVWDIYGVFRVLTRPMNCYTGKSVVEALYCIGTFLLYFERDFGLPHRYHYIVYYGLYLYENSWHGPETPELLSRSGGQIGQQSIRSFFAETKRAFSFTHEQKRILNHDLQPNQVVRIIAFAGTGKTSTLVRFAQDRPSSRFLVVLYNKSAQLISQRKFPQNCVVKTAHALAYADVGYRYSHKQGFNIKAQDVEKSGCLGREPGRGHYYRRCAIVGKTIESFCNSSDPLITLRHVPEKWNADAMDDDERLKFVEDAVSVWKEIIDPSSGKMKVTFDGYFKIWQLSKPFLRDPNTRTDYDCILIDEGQDMNPAMVDVLMRQACSKIIVGDPYQQIYLFRGAVNALDLVPSTHTYYLTQSFRFGPEIGFVADTCLSALRDVKTRTLVGGAKDDDVTGSKDYGNSITIIGRSNMGVYREAIRQLIDQPLASANANKRIAFSGGFESYNYVQILDLWYLKIGVLDNISEKNKWLKKFGGYENLRDYAEKTMDMELLSKIAMVEYTGIRTEHVVTTLQRQCRSEDTQNADIVFSTAHKSKGLEWDRVMVLEDFTDNIPLIREAKVAGLLAILPRLSRKIAAAVAEEDEVNLLYVATTRAKKQLILSPNLFFVLQEVSMSEGNCNACRFSRILERSWRLIMDRFERPVLLSSVLEKTPSATCNCCQKPLDVPDGITSRSIVLRTPSIRLSCGNMQNERYVCTKCAYVDRYPLPLHLLRSLSGGGSTAVLSEDRNHVCLRSILGPLKDEEKEVAEAFSDDLDTFASNILSFFDFVPEGPPSPMIWHQRAFAARNPPLVPNPVDDDDIQLILDDADREQREVVEGREAVRRNLENPLDGVPEPDPVDDGDIHLILDDADREQLEVVECHEDVRRNLGNPLDGVPVHDPDDDDVQLIFDDVDREQREDLQRRRAAGIKDDEPMIKLARRE